MYPFELRVGNNLHIRVIICKNWLINYIISSAWCTLIDQRELQPSAVRVDGCFTMVSVPKLPSYDFDDLDF